MVLMAWSPGEVLGETIAQPDSLNTLRQTGAAPRRLGCAWKVRVNYGLPRGALNSAVECHLHTVEVAGSNPAAPTKINKLQLNPEKPILRMKAHGKLPRAVLGQVLPPATFGCFLSVAFLLRDGEHAACPGILEHPQRSIGTHLDVTESVINIPAFGRLGSEFTGSVLVEYDRLNLLQ